MVLAERWERLLDKICSGREDVSVEVLETHDDIVGDLLTYLGCVHRSSDDGWLEVIVLLNATPVVIPEYSLVLPDPPILGYLSDTKGERQAFDLGGNEALAKYRSGL